MLTAEEAKALAERRLDSLRAQRVSAAVDCGWAAAGLRPWQLLMLDGESGRWRVQRWTLGDMRVKLELVRERAVAAIGSAASPGRPTSEPDLVHGPTQLRLYDLPLTEIGPDRRGGSLSAPAAGGDSPVIGMSLWDQAAGHARRWTGLAWSDGKLPVVGIVVAGKQVAGERLAAVPSPSGGTTIDEEVRAAIAALTVALKTHGLTE